MRCSSLDNGLCRRVSDRRFGNAPLRADQLSQPIHSTTRAHHYQNTTFACRHPLQPQNIPCITPGHPHKALFRIGQFSTPVAFGRSTWDFSSHFQALRCKSPGTHVLNFPNFHTCNTWKIQLIQVFGVTTENAVTNVVCVKKDICFLARTYISRRRNT